MAHPGRLFYRAWISGNIDVSTHIGAGCRRDQLSTIEILDPISNFKLKSQRSLQPKLISIIGDGYRPHGRSSLTLRTSLIGFAS